MTYKTIEDKIRELFDEIEKSGELIKEDMQETKNGFMGLGMMGMIGMMDNAPKENVDEPVHLMGLVAMDPEAGKRDIRYKSG